MRDICTAPILANAQHSSMPASLSQEPRLQGWAALLKWFYLRAGRKAPRLSRLSDEQLPSPYKSLLAHSADMTPTLEAFYRQPLGLEVLNRELYEDTYRREVVLTVARERQPVLYGAIRIFLSHLPEAARRRALEECHPLGRILRDEAIPHMSWPQAFFSVEPDSHMVAVLRLTQNRSLYGRRNVQVDGSRRLLAEVIEILAPAETPAA